MLTGKNYIGYKQYGTGGYSFSVTADISFTEATPAETDRAVTLAEKAFQVYRNIGNTKKINFFELLAAAIAAANDKLVKIAMQETNLSQPRLEGEIQRTINQIKLFAALLQDGSWVKAIIDTAQPERKPLPKPDIRQMENCLPQIPQQDQWEFAFA